MNSFHRHLVILLLAVVSITFSYAQVRPAYNLFDAQGAPIGHDELIASLSGADVVLFGEYHNNAIDHWLQFLVARELLELGPLIMGAEMIEADDQGTLDRYLRGEIDQAAFDSLARLWVNHASDYAPLVELAREHRIPFIATNVPRRYARAVARGGFDALDTVPDTEKQWIAPLPIPFDPDLPGYAEMIEMMGGHGSPDVVKAQALKDATMAHFISRQARPGMTFLHFNGTYHSDNHEGIGWYLREYQPELSQFTIATVTQDQVTSLNDEHYGKADIIICVDEAIPGTH